MKKMRSLYRDVNFVLSDIMLNTKEDKTATTINLMKAIKDLAEIKNGAYAVVSYDEETADCLLINNIRRQAQAGDRILVFCLDAEAKVKAIKYSNLTTGDITIIRINTNEYLVDEIDLIINYIADISSYDTVYFIGLVYDESSVANMIELDKIARRIEVPIFVGIQCIDGACKIPTKVFSIEPIPELTSEWDMLAYYFLSYSDTNRKCLMAYDLFTNRFADIENPFEIEE